MTLPSLAKLRAELAALDVQLALDGTNAVLRIKRERTRRCLKEVQRLAIDQNTTALATTVAKAVLGELSTTQAAKTIESDAQQLQSLIRISESKVDAININEVVGGNVVKDNVIIVNIGKVE